MNLYSIKRVLYIIKREHSWVGLRIQCFINIHQENIWGTSHPATSSIFCSHRRRRFQQNNVSLIISEILTALRLTDCDTFSPEKVLSANLKRRLLFPTPATHTHTYIKKWWNSEQMWCSRFHWNRWRQHRDAQSSDLLITDNSTHTAFCRTCIYQLRREEHILLTTQHIYNDVRGLNLWTVNYSLLKHLQTDNNIKIISTRFMLIWLNIFSQNPAIKLLYNVDKLNIEQWPLYN